MSSHRPETAPQAFELAVKMMNSQSLQPTKWLISDDGKTPLSKETINKIQCDHEIIQLEPLDTVSQARNLAELAKRVPDNAKLVIWEDDDYYPAEYLDSVSRALNKDNFIGISDKRTYHVTSGKYNKRNGRADALHGFAMYGDAVVKFKAFIPTLVPDTLMIDWKFLNKYYPDGATEHNEAVPVHIVGMGEKRAGITRDHTCSDHKKFTIDTDSQVLRQWVQNNEIFRAYREMVKI